MLIRGPWGGTLGGGTLVRCVRWGGGGGGWPMCWGGAGCPCIILAAAAAVSFHLHAEQPLLLLAQFAIAKVVVQQLYNRITLPTQLVPSSITVSRDAEVSDKNTYQMATSFPRNWENLSRENYDTHARCTTFFFLTRDDDNNPLSRQGYYCWVHNSIRFRSGNRRQTVKKDFLGISGPT